MNTPVLTIDARMLFSSGIGCVLQNVIARLPDFLPKWKLNLLVHPDDLPLHPALAPCVNFIEVQAPIYSLRELWEIPPAVPVETSVLWCPHYNAPLFTRAPLVTTIHDVSHFARPDFFPGTLRKSAARLRMLRTLAISRCLVTVSDHTSSELKKYFPRVKHHLIRRIYPGVDDSWFLPPEPRPKQNLFSETPPYFIYAGNLKPHKNVTTLIRAFLSCSNQLPHHLKLVCDPDAPSSTDFEALELARNHPSRIHFTGKLSTPQLQTLMASASALILPSFYEGFGLPPLEAMAARCPTAVSELPVFREIYGKTFFPDDPDSSGATLYFDPRDVKSLSLTLKTLANLSEPNRSRLLENARHRAEIYSWNLTTRHYAEIFRSLANHPSPFSS